MKNKRSLAFGIILTVLSACDLIGMLTFLAPCGPKEDGSWMTCHWAGQALIALAILLAVFSVIHLVVPSPRTKQGLSLAILPTALVAAILPGNLISLCAMPSMHCHMVTRPGALVFGVLIALIALADLLVNRKDA